jgi:ribosomal protein L11 methyltransferase
MCTDDCLRKNQKGLEALKPNTNIEWLEFSVQISPEASESVTALFDRLGEGGAVIESLPVRAGRMRTVKPTLTIKTYLPADRKHTKRRKEIENGLQALKKIQSKPKIRMRKLTPSDWTEAWKKGYRTQKIGRHLMIVATWKKYSVRKGEIVIRIDPGMAFGTGLHSTTRLCLIALERYVQRDDRVLDIGTGSGIQAIAAVKLGACEVTALDIEETAVKIARQNTVLNNVSNHVQIHLGTLEALSGQIQPAQIIVVNILTYTIINMLAELKEELQPGGFLICGGILSEFAREFETALTEAQLKVIEILSEGDWITFVARKAPFDLPALPQH